MKNILFVLITLLMIGCGGNTQVKEKTSELPDPSQLVEIRLDVKGMTCGGCENSVIRSVSNLKGVYEADASFEEELVVVKYNPDEVSKEQVAEAITRVGYQVEGEK